MARNRASQPEAGRLIRRFTDSPANLLASFSGRTSYYREAVVQHQEHEINVALNGEGLYHLGHGQTLALAAGEILLLPAGTFHGIEVQRRLRMAVIHFHPDVFGSVSVAQEPHASIVQQLKGWTAPLPVRKVTAPNTIGLLERLTEEAMVEQHRREIGGASLLGHLAGQAAVHFLRLMLQTQTPEPSDVVTSRIRIVQGWIDRHFAEPCGVVSLARLAHLAPTYFASRFRAVIGTPPMAYVCERRLEQARLLLERTDQPVKLIAPSVGFPDVSHFNHTFKQATGMTPVAYRDASQVGRVGN